MPGVTNFTDGIIQLEMSWGDDDSWGVVLRKTADKKGYLVVFGYIETPAVIVAILDKGCTEVGKCLDQTSCENNPGNTLVQVEHKLNPTDKENKVVYFGRIEARGNTIRVWYKARSDVLANSVQHGGKLRADKIVFNMSDISIGRGKRVKGLRANLPCTFLPFCPGLLSQCRQWRFFVAKFILERSEGLLRMTIRRSYLVVIP